MSVEQKTERASTSKAAGFELTIAALLAGSLLAGTALADGGRVQISHTDALAGNVTPGDAPGYPVTISQGGSYVLTSNLDVPNENTHAIEVTAHRVTIDLNGFALKGVTNCSGGITNGQDIFCTPTGTGRGISATTVDFGTIRNGSILSFGSHGIAAGDFVRIDNVDVSNNGGDGINLGIGCIVRDSVTRHNGGSGITTSLVNVLVNNTAGNNKSYGIVANAGSVIIGNSGSDNGGIAGIRNLAGAGVLHDNTAENNFENGIAASAGSVVTRNVTRNNEFNGLWLNAVAGYALNVVDTDSVGDATVLGGVNMGNNVCDGNTTCP